MAVGYDVGSQVNMVWASGGLPQSGMGQIQEVIGGLVVVKPDSADLALPNKESKLVLCLGGEANVKVTARVVESGEGTISLLPSNYQHMNRRDYPRVEAEVGLMYRASSTSDGLSKAQKAALSDWSRPLSHGVNFSVNGLAFVSAIPVPEDALLDMRVCIPTAPDTELTVQGQVVRCFETADNSNEDGESDVAYRLAIQLVNMTEAVRDAFVDYTLAQQEAMLSDLSPNGAEG